jgi:protein-export membrane protein SecD
MSQENKTIITRLLALLPFFVCAYFVTFSQPEIFGKLYEKLSFNENVKSAVQGFTASSLENFKKYPFRLGLDLSSGVRLTYKADTSKISNTDKTDALNVLREVIERRVNAFGVSEPLVQIQSSILSNEDRMLVELPGLTDINQALQLIGQTPTLEFVLERDASSSEALAIATAKAKYRADLAAGKSPVFTPLLLEDESFKRIGLDGRLLANSQLVFDGTTGQPQVSIEWNEDGKKVFAETTSKNIGKRIGIILDGTMISAPTIQTAITDGKAVITGIGNRQEAKDLAARLKTGALPVPIAIAGTEVVEPILGAKALEAGLLAAFYGFLAILLLMLLWYRLPGLVGVFALFTYVAIVLSIFKIIPVTLSAAAIAGFIISIGLAVDGNILIFERLKEELKNGLSITDALDKAFGRAWTSIRDSNIASLIVAVILFFIGTSVVQGFALTLMIGVLVSMFSSVVVTRTILKMIATNKVKKFFWTSPF